MRQLWAPWRMAYLQSDKEAEGGGCLFCHKIQADDAAEQILYRGEHCYITLNRYPYNTGHLLIVPYRHVDRLDALDEVSAAELVLLTQAALRVLEVVYHPQGFNMGINQGRAAGAGVAEHLHLHVVPRWSGDANYMTTIAETRVMPETLAQTYERLLPHFRKLRDA